MNIDKVEDNKKQYIDLLILADEQESMVDKYLERGDMYVMYDGDVVAECVVTHEGDGVYELKNIATYPDAQRKGYASALIEYVFNKYDDCRKMYVGTGDSPLSIPFYEKCGFKESHRVKNFFTDNYDHAMFECGKQLIDMVYLVRER